MEKLFTLSVFTENKIGLLNRVTIIFTRRHLNIESITASESEVHGVFRYTIVTKTTRDQVDKVVGQLEKLVEVLKAFVHEEDEVIHQEVALYKIAIQSLNQADLERFIREYHARILSVHPGFLVIEKTGHKAETQELFTKLQEHFGILEFARSGRVAVTVPMKELTSYLQEQEALLIDN